jgi:hypothetical protein
MQLNTMFGGGLWLVALEGDLMGGLAHMRGTAARGLPTSSCRAHRSERRHVLEAPKDMRTIR